VFAADREVGFAFYNSSQDERLTWTTGCFFDSISEGFKKRLDDNQGYRVSGRLTWLPYDNDQPKSRRLIHTGLGVLFTDDNDDRIRIRTRPQVSEGPRLIDSGLIKADSYTSGNVEGAIVLGRFAIQSEAFLGTVQMPRVLNSQVPMFTRVGLSQGRVDLSSGLVSTGRSLGEMPLLRISGSSKVSFALELWSSRVAGRTWI
jgi:hypothetical protein